MADFQGELTISRGNEKNNQMTEDEHWLSCATQLACSSVVLMVMKEIIDLGVLEIISKTGGSGVSADEIASQLDLTDDTTAATASSMLDRMLCLLTAHSIITCTGFTKERRLYELAPLAKYFIPNANGTSLGPYLFFIQDKVIMDSWRGLKPAVLEGGIPFNKIHGINLFDYMGKDLRFNELFSKAMVNQTTTIINKILESYKGFEQFHQVVDIGGGLGVTIKLITSKYPHIKGINFDLPHVIQHAQGYPGVEHITGDMFESVPSGDAIFMKWILHDWSDDLCLKLLKNCYKALPDKGKVIIVEGILPVVPDTSPTTQVILQLDIVMMTQTPGGKERTRQEFLSLATGAGFAGILFVCCISNFWVMEFYK